MSRSIWVPLFVLVAMGASILVSADTAPATRAKAPANVPKELLEKRLDAARNAYRMNLARLRAGEAVLDERFLSWSEHWLNAELSLSDKRPDRIATLNAHLDRMKELEKIATMYAKTGQGREADAQAATYARIDAEIRVLEAAPE